jgi:hypothetical protein
MRGSTWGGTPTGLPGAGQPAFEAGLHVEPSGR